MKKNILIVAFIYLLTAALVLAGCDKEPEEVQFSIPTATFSINSDQLSVDINQLIEISALPQPQGSVSNKWYVDGILESTSEVFRFEFKDPGKKIVKYVAKNGAGEFSKEFTVFVGDIVDIELSIGDQTEISVHKGEFLKVSAIVNTGANITHKWWIDDVEVGEDFLIADGNFVLTDLKIYKVRYEGGNETGKVTRAFDVVVLDQPLEVEVIADAEKIVDSEITHTAGKPFTFTANIIHGGRDARHEWRLNGVLVSSTETYTMNSNSDGEFTVSYTCENAKGEKVEKMFKVTLLKALTGWMVSDLENFDLSSKRFTPSWKEEDMSQWSISVSDNPDKSGINDSDKCLKQLITGNSNTTGTVWVNFNRLGITEDISEYRRIRFKYYKSTDDRYAKVEVDGGTATVVDGKNGMNAPINTWVEVEYIFTQKQYARITIKTLQRKDESVTGKEPALAYIDDIELFKE